MIGGGRGAYPYCQAAPHLPFPVNLSGLAAAGKAFSGPVASIAGDMADNRRCPIAAFLHRMPVISLFQRPWSRPGYCTPGNQERSPAPARRLSG